MKMNIVGTRNKIGAIENVNFFAKLPNFASDLSV
jgi:hypothetical protein